MPHHHDWHHEGHKGCNYTFTSLGGLWDCKTSPWPRNSDYHKPRCRLNLLWFLMKVCLGLGRQGVTRGLLRRERTSRWQQPKKRGTIYIFIYLAILFLEPSCFDTNHISSFFALLEKKRGSLYIYQSDSLGRSTQKGGSYIYICLAMLFLDYLLTWLSDSSPFRSTQKGGWMEHPYLCLSPVFTIGVAVAFKLASF